MRIAYTSLVVCVTDDDDYDDNNNNNNNNNNNDGSWRDSMRGYELTELAQHNFQWRG
jgi:hypothetical protein